MNAVKMKNVLTNNTKRNKVLFKKGVIIFNQKHFYKKLIVNLISLFL